MLCYEHVHQIFICRIENCAENRLRFDQSKQMRMRGEWKVKSFEENINEQNSVWEHEYFLEKYFDRWLSVNGYICTNILVVISL